jgi:Xaa-Pro aminopeptidase
MENLLRQKHHETVVDRLRSLMTDARLDAAVALSNENITYINTLPSSFLNDSGWLGLAMIVVPREGEIVGICSDFERPALETEGMVPTWHDFHMWMYIDDQFISGRRSTVRTASESFQGATSIGILTDYLKSRGIDHGRIGVEKRLLPLSLWEELLKALPDTSFVDSSALFYNARYVKTPYEIQCLRHAAQCQEKVLLETMAEIDVGTSHADILGLLRSRALAMPGIDRIRFVFVSIGPRFAPCAAPYNIQVAPGDLIKYDGALVVRGYGGDAGRTFVAGKPSADQDRIHRALLRGHEAALELMKPGVPLKQVFQRAMQVAQENGLPHYARGHVGHSVGLDQTVEEPPFISPNSERPMVPGNVFCLELPYYAHGFGSIQFEDILLITESGHELLTTSSKALNTIGSRTGTIKTSLPVQSRAKEAETTELHRSAPS